MCAQDRWKSPRKYISPAQRWQSLLWGELLSIWFSKASCGEYGHWTHEGGRLHWRIIVWYGHLSFKIEFEFLVLAMDSALGLPSWEWVPQSILVPHSQRRTLQTCHFILLKNGFFSYNFLNVKHFCKAEELLSPNQEKQQDKFSLESSVRGLQFSSVDASS